MFFQNETIRLCRSSCVDLLTCEEFRAELCSLMARRFVRKNKIVFGYIVMYVSIRTAVRRIFVPKRRFCATLRRNVQV
jgi:hypothetical protein